MTKAKRSRRLVIDADIARACGESGSTRAAVALEFLTSVFSICHRVVVTGQIAAQWDEHQSRRFRKWRAAMESRRKIVDLGDPKNRKMRSQILQIGFGPQHLAEASNDAHLLEAAEAADRVICSFDSTARGYFRRLSKAVEWVRRTRLDQPRGRTKRSTQLAGLRSAPRHPQNKNGPDFSGPGLNSKRPAGLLLFLRSSLLLRRRFLLGCVLHRLILPLHQDSRHSSSERGCVPFIRFFALKVKRKMHRGTSRASLARAVMDPKRAKT